MLEKSIATLVINPTVGNSTKCTSLVPRLSFSVLGGRVKRDCLVFTGACTVFRAISWFKKIPNGFA